MKNLLYLIVPVFILSSCVIADSTGHNRDYAVAGLTEDIYQDVVACPAYMLSVALMTDSYFKLPENEKDRSFLNGNISGVLGDSVINYTAGFSLAYTSEPITSPGTIWKMTCGGDTYDIKCIGEDTWEIFFTFSNAHYGDTEVSLKISRSSGSELGPCLFAELSFGFEEDDYKVECRTGDNGLTLYPDMNFEGLSYNYGSSEYNTHIVERVWAPERFFFTTGFWIADYWKGGTFLDNCSACFEHTNQARVYVNGTLFSRYGYIE